MKSRLEKIMMLIVAIIVIFSYALIGGEKTYGDIDCSYVRNYDGDTITVNIEGFPAIIGKRMSIRVNGIDTPEIRGTKGNLKKRAIAAKEFTKEFCKNGKIELRNMKRGKYFRIVADVFVNGESLGKALIKKGLAERYGDRRGLR